MQVIRYMMFKPGHNQPNFYMVGTDIAKMRATAKHVDPNADEGLEINSERALEAADTDRKRHIFEDGVRAAKSGTTDYYLFG